MRQFKAVLFTLLAIAVMGALTAAPAQRSQASNQPNRIPRPVYLSDLIVSDVEPVYTNSYRQYQGSLVPDEVWIKVTNQGAGNAGPFNCFFEWDFSYSYEQEFFYMQNGLAAGQSIWVLASSNGYNLWDANHQFRFTANIGNGIAETDYTNNTYAGP